MNFFNKSILIIALMSGSGLCLGAAMSSSSNQALLNVQRAIEDMEDETNEYEQTTLRSFDYPAFKRLYLPVKAVIESSNKGLKKEAEITMQKFASIVGEKTFKEYVNAIAKEPKIIAELSRDPFLVNLAKTRKFNLANKLQNVNEPIDENGTTLLIAATHNQKIPLVQELLKLGAAPYLSTKKENFNALHFAKGTKNKKLISLLENAM